MELSRTYAAAIQGVNNGAANLTCVYTTLDLA
jgi:hypothetical protein|eukprot:COSAG06_NODE_1433_length_9477_cov_69.462301_12_plen_32_part_00